MERSRVRFPGPLLAMVAVLTASAAIGYVRLLAEQGDWPALDPRQAFVLAVLIACSVGSIAAAFARSPVLRAAWAAASAGALLPLGVLALFSVGLPLICAGGIAVIAWLGAARDGRDRRTTVTSAVSAVAALAILATGFVLTG